MFSYFKSAFLHATNEVGAGPEQRYKAASSIYRSALRAGSKGSQHRQLHWALDVVLCEGRFDDLEVGTDLHRRYWTLGHQIATEILKHQDILNIQQVWFANDYDDAKAMLAAR